MPGINTSRVLVGGLLAGLIIDVSEYILNMPVLGEAMAAANRALNLPAEATGGQIAAYNVWSFVLGFFAVWLYAAIRPRYGPGPKTAVCAGIAVWFSCYVMGSAFAFIQGMYPANLMMISYAWTFVELIAATLAGAWLYRE